MGIMWTKRGRGAAALTAIVAWAAVLWLLHDQIGFTGESLPAAVWDDAGYLTDLGNLFIAVIFTAAALGHRSIGPWLAGQATVIILLVGIGAWTIAREYLVFGTRGVGDMLAHGLSPVVATIVWITFAPKQGLRWIDALLWLGVPLAYIFYAIARGFATGHFAYGWLDPRHGATSVAIIVLILLAMTMLIGLSLVAVARFAGRKSSGLES